MRVLCLRTDPFSDEQTNFVISDCRLGQNFSQLYDWLKFILWPIRRRHLISFRYCVGKPHSFALDSQHRWMAARHHWLGAHNCYDRQYLFTFLSPVSRKQYSWWNSVWKVERKYILWCVFARKTAISPNISHIQFKRHASLSVYFG